MSKGQSSVLRNIDSILGWGALVLLSQAAILATPIDLNSLNLVGTSQIISGDVLRLTPNFDTNVGPDGPTGAPPAGAAWTTNGYNVADAFSADFQFQFTDPTGHLDNGNGGDGIAFLIQNSPGGGLALGSGDTSLGEGAGGLGFLGITNSLAIMLDTYQNNSPDYYGDPSNNYIAVNTQGTGINVPHHYCTNGQLTADSSIGSDLPVPFNSCTANPTLGMTGSGGVPALSPNMDDGQVHDLGITYIPGTLDISLDSIIVLSVPLNLSATLDLQNGTNAFLGFTGGTRYAYQNQDVLNFSFTSAVPEPASGVLVFGGMAILMLLAKKKKAQTARGE